MYKEICLFSSFSKTNKREKREKKKKKASLLSEPAALVDSRAGPSLSFSQRSFPHVWLLWRYKARRELVNEVNKWRSGVGSQGQSFKLAMRLARSSDRSSYSIFSYLFIYLLFFLSCGPKKKTTKGRLWHLSDISGVGPITAPWRTHALWHRVSLCALQNAGHARPAPRRLRSLLQVSRRRWDGR